MKLYHKTVTCIETHCLLKRCVIDVEYAKPDHVNHNLIFAPDGIHKFNCPFTYNQSRKFKVRTDKVEDV